MTEQDNLWDGEAFYNLMQAYRHSPLADQTELVQNYGKVKEFIREQIAALKVNVEKQVIYIANLNDELADERERADDADKGIHHLQAEIEKLKLEMNRMVRY